MTKLIDNIKNLAERFALAQPEEILRWADVAYAPRLSLACSFGGPSGMVLLDLAVRFGVRAEVFYLDTGLLFPQVDDLRQKAIERYRIAPVAYHPDLSVDEQSAKFGPALWLRQPDQCCAMRKVEPNRRALAGKDAWITSLRRDQVSTRTHIQPVEWDPIFELVKVNPLAGWTENQVWDYIHEHDVPYNSLHDQGYPSIGCIPCTRPVNPGEDSRAGRWAAFEKTECGLHLRPARELAANGVVDSRRSSS